MPVYNLIEYSDNYSKTSGSLWQYYRDDPNDNIKESESLKYKIKIQEKLLPIVVADDYRLQILLAVPLKYLINFWRTLEMLLINCEINLILTWSEDCVISSANAEKKLK